MWRFTRREFAGAPLLAPLAAGLAAPLSGQAPPEFRRLAGPWPVEKVAAVIAARENWKPFPTTHDRAAWQSLPEELRAVFAKEAEGLLKTDWPALPATLFLEYARIGNRSRFEAVRNLRRGRLATLVLAECFEGKGRFLDDIGNGVWTTCEESFWGVPAHIGAQKAGAGLPDVAEPIVDLFAAETSSLLAWTGYLLGPALDQVHRLLRPRIALEIERRILAPCRERDDFGWMGFHARKAVNNWNPWIVSNWLTSILLVEPDPRRRSAGVHKCLRSLDRFLDGYAEDGGCDEGPGYWNRAGASLFDCLELLYSASGGRIGFFRMPLVAEIGRYIYRAHIAGEWYTNFADAGARVHISGDLVYRYGKRIGDENMQHLGAWAAFARPQGHAGVDSLGRVLPALFNFSELKAAPRRQPLVRDVWLPGIQVMAARPKEGSSDGLYLAAQGGHNDESHNHNDVGNFMVYADGHPAIVDVGVETYSAKTFSSRRYEIWTMQSAYHNLPAIDGVMQSAGRRFEARSVAYHATAAAAGMSLDIGAAYPAEAGIESWKRTLRLHRERNEVEVVDVFALKKTPRSLEWTLMTPVKPAVAPGRITLAHQAFRSGPVAVLFDPRSFTPKVEEIPIQDGRLRPIWGEWMYRILLAAASPAARGEAAVRIVQSKG